MRIDVTQEDISQGVPRHPRQCALARAITRQTGRKVTVSHYAVSIDDDTGACIATCDLPDEASDFARDFDYARYPVQPFSFDLPLETK